MIYLSFQITIIGEWGRGIGFPMCMVGLCVGCEKELNCYHSWLKANM